MNGRRRRPPLLAVLAPLAALGISACGSLDPCAIYGCPRIEVRSGPDCRQVFVVNPGGVAKTYSLRLVHGGLPGDVLSTGQWISAGGEVYLGCAPECLEQRGPCWYDLFDAKDAPSATP